jgi:hypothetical protein
MKTCVGSKTNDAIDLILENLIKADVLNYKRFDKCSNMEYHSYIFEFLFNYFIDKFNNTIPLFLILDPYFQAIGLCSSTE